MMQQLSMYDIFYTTITLSSFLYFGYITCPKLKGIEMYLMTFETLVTIIMMYITTSYTMKLIYASLYFFCCGSFMRTFTDTRNYYDNYYVNDIHVTNYSHIFNMTIIYTSILMCMIELTSDRLFFVVKDLLNLLFVYIYMVSIIISTNKKIFTEREIISYCLVGNFITCSKLCVDVMMYMNTMKNDELYIEASDNLVIYSCKFIINVMMSFMLRCFFVYLLK